MEDFESAVEKYLNPVEEGMLGRAAQRIKNVGRRVTHPIARMTGDHDASMASGKGYRKLKMTQEILSSAAQDLIKLGVVTSTDKKALTNAIIGFLRQTGALLNGPDDLSKHGKHVESEYENEVNRRLAARRSSTYP